MNPFILSGLFVRGLSKPKKETFMYRSYFFGVSKFLAKKIKRTSLKKLTKKIGVSLFVIFLVAPFLQPMLNNMASGGKGGRPIIVKRILSNYTVYAGGKNAAYLSSNNYIWPTRGRITQNYRWGHKGLDIALPAGNPCVASRGGIVEYAGWSAGYGYNVVINHQDGSKARYAHLSQILVGYGQGVSQGKKIGKIGSTGWSTGPHLHFEIIEKGVMINPLTRLK